ncbi:MAG: amidohydrolase, partial [Planctomycetes bacterium]|nr:amidohydrolase [Planctomycetota bacterium]
MKFIDSNCCLGELSVPLPKSFGTLNVLLDAMKQAGVDEALVYHAFSKEYNPGVGNQRLIEEIGDQKNLHACWVLLPHHTGEMSPPEKLVDELMQNGVKAVRFFPKIYNWSLAQWCAGKLLHALEDNSIPLFIDIDETDWNQVYSIASSHPKLPVVLTNATFRFNRQIYALLAETSNVFIDTSYFQLHQGIEDVCKKFGAKRLLFGTAAP